MQQTVVIIGAGPAGLTAADLLTQSGAGVFVIEENEKFVGGISRTVNENGFRFDIGGHRFFSKSEWVRKYWSDLLGEDLIVRRRKSRIYYRNQFFNYPLREIEAFLKLGAWNSFLCGLSYLYALIKPKKNPKSYEDWVCNQFGRRLFQIFFKNYTEKVWGIDCKSISADWAAQRIKGLSLWQAIAKALWPSNGSKNIKTLIDSFHYPRKGPGMMWETCASRIRKNGGWIEMGTRVMHLFWNEKTQQWRVRCQRSDGRTLFFYAHHLISTAPLREMIQSLEPAVSTPVREDAASLGYRDFILVALILEGVEAFDDQWIYIHDERVKVGRIQNFKSWSPEMVPAGSSFCLGMEYFCFEHEDIWRIKDEDLINLAFRELQLIGLAGNTQLVRGHVVRQPKAYPVYSPDYVAKIDRIRAELSEKFPTLHMVGRNGMHKYNNQDHSMMTAKLAAENILHGFKANDVWRVNQDAEYHEIDAKL